MTAIPSACSNVSAKMKPKDFSSRELNALIFAWIHKASKEKMSARLSHVDIPSFSYSWLALTPLALEN